MCIQDVACWFLENGLLLNPAKTEAVLFGTSAQRKKVPTASGIDVAGAVVPFRDTVKLLGITLESALTMDHHVSEVVRSCNYHIRSQRHIRPLLTFDAANVVGQWAQYCVIAIVLRQRTAVRHICSQHPLSAGCAELTGHSNLPSFMVSQCNRITSAVSLASSAPTH